MGNQASLTKKTKPAIIESIEKGSIGEELGFEVGDQIITINGVKAWIL